MHTTNANELLFSVHFIEERKNGSTQSHTIRGKLERAHHSTNSNDKRNVLVHRSLALSGNAGIIMFIIICFRFLCHPVSYARNGNNRKQRTRHDIRFFSDDLPLF